MKVRSFWRAVQVETEDPPYNTIHLKIYYPFSDERGNLEKFPLPVVIFFNAVNCESRMYHWLAIELVESGAIVVTFNWVADNPTGTINLSPGVDLNSWKKSYGKLPTASGLPSILNELERLQSIEKLRGIIDLEKIILGGHSIGGRVALENADPYWFSRVKAAFGYAAHCLTPVALRYSRATLRQLPSQLPILLMGGTKDGIIAKSSSSYGLEGNDPIAPLIDTFSEGFSSENNDKYLVLFQGANHYSIADPIDLTQENIYTDFPSMRPQEEYRNLIGKIIVNFIQAFVCHNTFAQVRLDCILDIDNPLIAKVARK